MLNRIRKAMGILRPTDHHKTPGPGDLFQAGNVLLNCGVTSFFKLECDALSDHSWYCLAAMAATILPPFGEVIGVPRGGLKFAKELQVYRTPGCRTILVAEDVCTTGGSMDKIKQQVHSFAVIGVAVFGRGVQPPWVQVLFPIHPKLRIPDVNSQAFKFAAGKREG